MELGVQQVWCRSHSVSEPLQEGTGLKNAFWCLVFETTGAAVAINTPGGCYQQRMYKSGVPRTPLVTSISSLSQNLETPVSQAASEHSDMEKATTFCLLALLLVGGVHGAAVTESCTGDPTLCDAGLVCDSDVCKLDAGGDCSGANSANCKTGTSCVSDVCKLDAGGDCSGANSANCKTGTSCVSDVCKVDVGGDCSGTASTHCAAGASCDSDVCKLDAGGDCSGANSANCKTGTSCVSDVCKVDVGGDCSGTASTHCTTDTTCDSDLCKLKEGVTCTPGANANCLAHSTCKDPAGGTSYVCSCDDGYTANTEKTLCSGGPAVMITSLPLMLALVVLTRLF
ncbi:uncharacterized protein LOC143286637 [Babylonia areolata]|uniref:uncharacterized protein LOC143286637 n=1 Tax=Babylonia areolata TaxID=304850 RepID=UPI003FD68595